MTEILHLTREWPVALVGAGFLGHAPASYRGFQRRGFVITCVFDDDPAKVGRTVGELVVQDAAGMATALRRWGIHIAILAVPAGEAQTTTDVLVEAGACERCCPTPTRRSSGSCMRGSPSTGCSWRGR